MSTQPDLVRKVRQLDNDVQSIYEMLAEISGTQRRQGNRLDEIASVQADHSSKLTDLATVQADHGSKLTELGTKLDTIIALMRRPD